MESKIYTVNGKEWIVGEKKISMWSKAKCNKDLKEPETEEKKNPETEEKKDPNIFIFDESNNK
jgi:hypothetical protein